MVHKNYHSFLVEYLVSFNQYIFRNLFHFMYMGILPALMSVTWHVPMEARKGHWIPWGWSDR